MAIKFDQQLWDARTEGGRAEDGETNPYLFSSSNWAAWAVGRAYGPGRIASARGAHWRADINGVERVLSCEDIQALLERPVRTIAITYAR